MADYHSARFVSSGRSWRRTTRRLADESADGFDRRRSHARRFERELAPWLRNAPRHLHYEFNHFRSSSPVVIGVSVPSTIGSSDPAHRNKQPRQFPSGLCWWISPALRFYVVGKRSDRAFRAVLRSVCFQRWSSRALLLTGSNFGLEKTQVPDEVQIPNLWNCPVCVGPTSKLATSMRGSSGDTTSLAYGSCRAGHLSS